MKTAIIPAAATAAVMTSEAAAKAISGQYQVVARKTGELIREGIKFGVMLIQWEAFLGVAKRGRGNEGGGLRNWLELNCPEINYNTAMGYKSLAAKNVALLGGGAVAMAALQGVVEVVNPDGEAVEVSDDVIRRRERIFEEADSRRKLERLFFEYMGVATEGRAGRPKGSRNRAAPAAAKSAAEAAQEFWALTMDRLQGRSAALQSAAMLLTGAQAEAALTVLGDLVAALEARLDEAARG